MFVVVWWCLVFLLMLLHYTTPTKREERTQNVRLYTHIQANGQDWIFVYVAWIQFVRYIDLLIWYKMLYIWPKIIFYHSTSINVMFFNVYWIGLVWEKINNNNNNTSNAYNTNGIWRWNLLICRRTQNNLLCMWLLSCSIWMVSWGSISI